MLTEYTSAPKTRSGLWFLVCAGTLWGTGGLTGTLLARTADLSPLAVAAGRLGVGGLLLFVIALLARRALPRDGRAWMRVVVVGLLAAEFQASYFAAVAITGVSLATLISIGASPVIVLLVEAVAGRGRIGGRAVAGRGRIGGRAVTPCRRIGGRAVAARGWIGGRAVVPRRRIGGRDLLTVGLAVGGLVLLVGVPSGGRDVGTMLAGGGFALLAAAGFATMTLVGTWPVAGLDDLTSTGLAFTLGSAVLIPIALLGPGLTFEPTPAALGWLVLLGVGPTAIAYAAYFRGLRTTPARTAALMALLEPLVGTVLAVLILGDRLGPAGIAGAAVLIVALVLEQRLGRR